MTNEEAYRKLVDEQSVKPVPRKFRLVGKCAKCQDVVAAPPDWNGFDLEALECSGCEARGWGRRPTLPITPLTLKQRLYWFRRRLRDRFCRHPFGFCILVKPNNDGSASARGCCLKCDAYWEETVPEKTWGTSFYFAPRGRLGGRVR